MTHTETPPRSFKARNADRKLFSFVQKIMQDPRFSLETAEGQRRYAEWHMEKYGCLPEN